MMMRSIKIMSLMTAAAVAFAFTGVPVEAAPNISKEETVYIVTDSTGKPDEVVVSDELKNDIEADTIDDRTNLKDIENVKGDETFSRGKGSEIIWDAEGSDIFYEGNSRDKPPVTMDITYKLDGVEVSGSELEGKSGDVEISIKFRNDAKATVNGRETTVPFVALMGFIADDETFSDITIDHGKVIDDGDKKMVVGMAVPGLADALSIDLDRYNIDLSDRITITGKAKKYNVQDIMTVVTNSVFEEIDTTDLGVDFDDDIKKLDDGARALVDGSNTLYRGINTLYENMPELEEGISALKDGADRLDSGTQAAKKGAEDLDSGARQLKGELDSQMSDMKSGTKSLRDGAGNVLNGLKNIKTGLDGDGTTSNPGAIKALENVQSGLEQVLTGLDGDGTSANPGAIRAVEGVDNALTATRSGAADVYQYLEELRSAYNGLSDSEKAKVKSTIGEDLVNKLTSDSGVISESRAVAGAVTAVTEDGGSLDQIKGGLEDIGGGVTASKNGVATVNSGLKDASAGLGGYDPSRGTGQTSLIGGQTVIYHGLDTLYGKLVETTGAEGKLTLGLNSLVSGTGALKKGEVTLAGGAKQLADGMRTLQDSSGTLAEGVTKLDRGSLELSKGMSRFYEEGIKQLVDMYENDLKGSVDDIKGLIDASHDYKVFSDIAEDMDGNVKFIYKTSIY